MIHTLAAGGANPGAIVGIIFLVALALAFWLVPIYIAHRRHARNFGAIVVITLLLGWTFIGWVVALAMALSDPRETRGHIGY
jgi:hypothetical protein